MALVTPVAIEAEHDTVPLQDVLQAVARELDLIVELGERTQTAITPLLEEACGPALQAQHLDALVQQASGLAAFVVALSRACPDMWAASPLQAADALLLHAQRRRLSFPLIPDVALPVPGVFELF